MYYHMLANQAKTKPSELKSIGSYEAQRVWFWFPLFSFFESGVDGKVPNEFAWPIRLHDVNESLTQVKELLRTFMARDQSSAAPLIKPEPSKKNGLKKRIKTK